jgi:hypothetical protein
VAALQSVSPSGAFTSHPQGKKTVQKMPESSGNGLHFHRLLAIMNKKSKMCVFQCCAACFPRVTGRAERGNQVQVLSDPVTVIGECGGDMPLCPWDMRRRRAHDDPKVRKPAEK